LRSIPQRQLPHRLRVPARPPGLGRDTHDVEDAGDLFIREPLHPELRYFVDRRLFPLKGHGALLAPLKAEWEWSGAPAIGRTEGDAEVSQILQNGLSGGKNLGSDLPRREALGDVFLVEENRVGVGAAEGEVNEIGAVAVEENRFGTVFRGPPTSPLFLIFLPLL
jgi:hypothetical protein